MAGEPSLVRGSFLSGSARDLKEDQLAVYGRVLREFGGRRVRFRVGPPRLGFLFDAVFRPDGARHVLATDAAHYDKEVPGIDEARRLFGNGILFSNGDRWRRDRRIVAPLFTKKRIASYVGAMAAAADRLASTWAEAPGGRVDLAEAGMHYALDVLGRSVFGADVESTAPVLRATVPVLNEYAARRILSPVRLPGWVPTPSNRRAEAARRALWGQVDGLIARRRAGALDGDDLLTLLLTARDPEDGSALDDDAVRDQALILLLGGHETTGTTMALALHLLGRHPDVQQRVRDEVHATIGARPVEIDDLPQLTFTARVLDETMRLYPPGHTLVRHAVEPTTLDGEDVPAGHLVAVSVWGVHHNPEVWPDPGRFDADRFASTPGRYHHLPFGGGPRGCIGQHMATAELLVAVATLVRAFHLATEADDVTLDVGLALRPRGPLPCRVTPLGPHLDHG
jgi:cytochrome P450